MPLKEIDLHLTNSCSMRCNHCVFSSGERDFQEMNFEKVSGLIDEFADISNHEGTINLFGGEVLLQKDIFTIIHAVRSKGLLVGITSNCEVPATTLERVMSEDIQRFTSDLDGSTPETHDELRNKSGNFEKVLKALKQSVAKKIFTTVNSVLTMDNIHQIEEVLELSRDIGVHGLAFYYLTPTGRGVNIKNKCIGAEKWMELKRVVEEWVKKNNPSFIVCWEEAYEAKDSCNPNTWRCEKEHTETVFIRCDGEVYSCALLEGSPRSMGNVQMESLREILARREKNAFERSNGCPALAFHVENDLSKPDPRTTSEGIRLGCPYNYQYLNGK